MPEGTVKWFDSRKGYGFILDGQGQDVFVHYANISGDGYRTLNEGDAVTFEVVESEKGLRAENIVPQSASEEPETEEAQSQETSESK